MVKNTDDRNSSPTILVDNILLKVNFEIKILREVDVDKHEYEIQLLEYLQNNIIHLDDFRNQIPKLISYCRKNCIKLGPKSFPFISTHSTFQRLF